MPGPQGLGAQHCNTTDIIHVICQWRMQCMLLQPCTTVPGCKSSFSFQLDLQAWFNLTVISFLNQLKKNPPKKQTLELLAVLDVTPFH